MKADTGDAVIEKFFLRGDLSHRQQLLDGFDQQHWHGRDSQRVFIIRRVEVAGPWWQVCQRVAERVQALVHEALPAEHPDSQEAKAVYFTSQAHFYARFCWDLAQGQSQAWYWQHYPELSMKPEQAIAGIFTDNIFHLPKILAILEAQQAIEEVFLPLDVDALERILVAIGQRTGWTAVLGKPQSLEPDAIATSDALFTPECLAALALWRPLLNQTSVRKKIVLLRFISAILAWRYAPKVLNRKEQLSLWQIAIEKHLLSEAHTMALSHRAVRTKNQTEQAEPPTAFGQQEKQAPHIVRAAGEDVKTQRAFFEPRHASSERDSETEGGDACQLELTPFSGDAFFSQCAGVFFLLNAIDQLKLFSLSPRALPSLWRVLYRLSLRLKGELDAPMSEFLALQNSLYSAAQLDTLGPLEGEDELIARAEKRFAQHDFWPRELIAMPGLVCFNESHLDVYFHMKCLRLDIRLAGLDINPGWLPWLGRVVSFHYGRDPAAHHSGGASS